MSISFRPLPHGVTWTHYRVVQTSLDPDGYVAMTGYEILASYQSKGSDDDWAISNAKVTVKLVPADTWVVTGNQVASVLNHESLHYVIATLVGRELDKELAGVTGSSSDDVLQQASDLVDAKNARALAIGQTYDDDTDHGNDAAQQKLWQNKVHGWENNNNGVSWP